nr:putative ORF1 [Marmot picobirnavirus]
MTKNQLEYLGLEETKRNNMVVSAETNRHNVATEAETGRHNLVTEGETHRHDLVLEDQGQQQISETVRSNKERERQGRDNIAISQGALKETKRHDKATEKIQRSVPIQSANISAKATKAAAKTNAQASKYNTNAQYRTANLDRQFKAWNAQSERNLSKLMNAANNQNKKEIAESQNDVKRDIADLDRIFKQSQHNDSMKAQYAKLRNDVTIAIKNGQFQLVNTGIHELTNFVNQFIPG